MQANETHEEGSQQYRGEPRPVDAKSAMASRARRFVAGPLEAPCAGGRGHADRSKARYNVAQPIRDINVYGQVAAM